MEIQIEAKFNESWIGEYKAQLNLKLTSVFRQITGFVKVIVNTVRDGSIVADYDLILQNLIAKADDKETQSMIDDEILVQDQIRANLGKLNLFDGKVNVSHAMENLQGGATALARMLKDPCKMADVSCHESYKCIMSKENKPQCQYRCDGYDCGQNGVCMLDIKKEPFCKCTEDDDYVYSGPHCEGRQEKLALTQNQIIGISVGCGGGLLAILIIIIIVLVVKRKRKQKKDEPDIYLEDLSERVKSSGSTSGPDHYLNTAFDGKPEPVIMRRTAERYSLPPEYEPHEQDRKRPDYRMGPRRAASETDHVYTPPLSRYEEIDLHEPRDLHEPHQYRAHDQWDHRPSGPHDKYGQPQSAPRDQWELRKSRPGDRWEEIPFGSFDRWRRQNSHPSRYSHEQPTSEHIPAELPQQSWRIKRPQLYDHAHHY